MNRVTVQGVPIDAIEPSDLMDAIRRQHAQGDATVAYANVHVVNQAQRDADLLGFLQQASMVYCDGTGVRLGARIAGQRLPPRSTGADWIWDLARTAAGTWRIYWIGGEPGVTAAAAAQLTARYPTLSIKTDHGFHPRTGAPDTACIERINGFETDILLVGMGTPEQERWVQQRRVAIKAPVVWCIGATADVISGKTPRGPTWLVEHAEWLARLSTEPARLWRRYLLGNPAFLIRALKQRMRD